MYRNLKDSTNKLLELKNEFSKAAEYIINVQKSVAFLYTNNEQSEKETKKPIPFISTKNNKILRNKFNKDNASLVH